MDEEPKLRLGARGGERGGILALIELIGCGHLIRFEGSNRVKGNLNKPTLGIREGTFDAISNTGVTEE